MLFPEENDARADASRPRNVVFNHPNPSIKSNDPYAGRYEDCIRIFPSVRANIMVDEMATDIQDLPAMRALAEQIANKARRLDQGGRHMSKAHHDEADSQTGKPEEELLQKTRTSMLDDCRALQNLLVEPGEKLSSMGLVVSSFGPQGSLPMDTATDDLRRISTTLLPSSSSITTPSHLMSRSTGKYLSKH